MHDTHTTSVPAMQCRTARDNNPVDTDRVSYEARKQMQNSLQHLHVKRVATYCAQVGCTVYEISPQATSTTPYVDVLSVAFNDWLRNMPWISRSNGQRSRRHVTVCRTDLYRTFRQICCLYNQNKSTVYIGLTYLLHGAESFFRS
jgi:hypothetical protein